MPDMLPDHRSHPGSADIAERHRDLLNAHPVPPGVHHDVEHPIPVLATLRWEGDPTEVVRTVAVEWTRELVRVRISDPRRHTGAAWLAAGDVKRVV